MQTPSENPPIVQQVSVDDYITRFEKEGKTPQDLEAFIRRYQNVEESALSDDLVRQLLAATRLHRRTTAGPPKTKAAAAKKAPLDVMTLL